MVPGWTPPTLTTDDSTTMTSRRPVLLIGWDAADQELVERLCATGELPTLSRLKARGAYGSLEGCASRFAGGVWPTFYTGRDVAWHGLYHNKIWRQERMQVELRAQLRARGEDGRAEPLGAARTRQHHRCEDRAALERKARDERG